MKRLISPTTFSGLAAASLILATISLGASPSLAEQSPGSHIGMGAKTCVPAPGADCSNVKHRWKFEHHGDLTGVNFSKAHLHGAKLHDATLKKANFAKAKLHRAKFHRANLNGATFDGAGLKGAEFYGAKLTGTSFVNANLKGAGFGSTPDSSMASRSSVDDCKANPSTACKYVTLNGADFSGANLAGANFAGALLVNVKFNGANLEGASFQGAEHRGSLFQKANLKGANFDSGILANYTDFTGADLTNARITGVTILSSVPNGDIGSPVFTGATLDGALMSWSYLAGSQFQNVHAHNVLMQSSNIVASWVDGSDWSGSNFSGTCAWSINTDVSITMDLTGAVLSSWNSDAKLCAQINRTT